MEAWHAKIDKINVIEELGASVAKRSKVISKQRSQIIEEVKKLLLVFINEKQSEAFICEKALDIYGDLVQIFKTLTP